MRLLIALLLLSDAAVAETLPRFPYGAVYFRKTNPPRQDWDRDYAQAARDGMNTFRHWVMWGSVEVAPGEFDWADYDTQLDLSAKHGIKAILAEIVHSAPEWAFREHAEAQFVGSDGRRSWSQMRNSSFTGGFPGLCLDNDEYRFRAERFLATMAARYSKHPGMGGYDIWNEANTHSSGFGACYCRATTEKFREWLRAKYGDVKTLGKAWNRFSYTSWEDVVPPRGSGLFPDYLDWTQFRLDSAFRWMKWRADVIRKNDPNHPVTAHGMYDWTLDRMVASANDHWRAAENVDIYGYTGNSANEDRIGKNYQRWLTVDTVRAGARGKAFWAAETAAGPAWSQRGVKNEGGRSVQPHDIRLVQMIMMAGGTGGIFSPRWRPLLDGPLYGHYGFYAMDGSPTPNSEMGSVIAGWANSPKTAGLFQSRPAKGDIGILFVPESEIAASLMPEPESYPQSARGAYMAFYDSNIQADFVHINDIGKYEVLYLPYPIMLSAATARKITDWVERGGMLISEGTPAYFDERAHVGTVQPAQNLDRLFGAREKSVEFTPDLLEDLTFRYGALRDVSGGINRQSYTVAEGQAKGWYSDGSVAAVENAFGKGRTLLIGTHPGAGYFRHHGPKTREFFAGLVVWADREQNVKRTGDLAVRLHTGDGGTFLWMINHKTEQASIETTTARKLGNWRKAEVLWGNTEVTVQGSVVRAVIPPLDAVVIRLVE